MEEEGQVHTLTDGTEVRIRTPSVQLFVPGSVAGYTLIAGRTHRRIPSPHLRDSVLFLGQFPGFEGKGGRQTGAPGVQHP